MAINQTCTVLARRLAASIEQRLAFSSLAPSMSSSEAPAWATCGRGDKRTKRGKRFKGSYGNSRPKMEKKIESIKDKIEVPRSTPWPLPFKLI